jgi:hypothetical protein
MKPLLRLVTLGHAVSARLHRQHANFRPVLAVRLPSSPRRDEYPIPCATF